jgi:mycothiol synthase
VTPSGRPAPQDVEVVDRLRPADVDAVRALVEAVQTADGTPPLSDHVLLHLPQGGDDGVRHLLVRPSAAGDSDSGLVGYAHLDVTDEVAGASAELAVHPRRRGRGTGRALVTRLLEQAPDDRLRLWAHGQHPAAGALATGLGFTPGRVLWQLRRSLTEPLPEVRLPEGITLRTFRVGEDEPAWTALNNRAFADHPDQGGWGVEEVRLREQEPWFDASGFFLAERATPAGPVLVGFHWTKVHGQAGAPSDRPDAAGADGHAHGPIGEVYVVGVDPAEQGRGLGPALTLVGLHSLRERGLAEAMLYVDASNTAAVKVYERLGFTRHATDVCYSRG